MKIKADQLSSQLARQLAPIYLVSGDEIVLVRETVATIRRHATNLGYCDRLVFWLDNSFSWENFEHQVRSYPLLQERRLIELHCDGKALGKGAQSLQKYLQNPDANQLWLLVMAKLESSQQQSAWYRAIDAQGVIIQIWPIADAQMATWLKRRLHQAELFADSAGIQWLAEQVRGNLLAATQEITKLSLQYGPGKLSLPQIQAAVVDQARFQLFRLVEAMEEEKVEEVAKILTNLQADHTELPIILGTIAYELRMLIKINLLITQGKTIEQAMSETKIYPAIRARLRRACQRYSLDQLQLMLNSLLSLDLIFKGGNQNRIGWHELEKFCLGYARGKPYRLD